MSVLGWAHGRVITDEMADVYCLSHPPPAALAHDGEAVRRWAARSVLVSALLEEEASRRGLISTEGLADAVADEVLWGVSPSPERTEAYVASIAPRFARPERRMVSHILTGSANLAARVARRAGGGEDFALLAERFSQDRGSRHKGGLLGWMGRGEMTGPFETVCFSARVGEVCGPVEGPFGWHVLIVRQVEVAQPADTASLYAVAQRDLVAYDRRQAYANWLAEVTRRSIEVPEGREHPAQPWALDLAHRH